MRTQVTEHVPHRAASGAFYLGVAQCIRLALSIGSTVLVARLLTPAEYGVVAMTAPVIAFITMFQDMGLSVATIQKKNFDEDLSSSLFWINFAFSLFLSVVLLAVAPLVGDFYNDFRVEQVIRASGMTLIAAGLSIQHAAILNRSLKFGKIAFADIVGSFAGFLLTIIVAFLYKTYWALYFGALGGACAQSIALWCVCKFRPIRNFDTAGVRELFAFGGQITSFNVLNFFVRNIDNVIIGRMFGSAALGLYDRSYKLMMMPIQNINAPIARVLLPTLSRLQDDATNYRLTFLVPVRLIMLITAPGILALTWHSEITIRFLLGPGWGDAAQIFFWLGLTGLVQPVANMTGVLFISSGRTKALMNWGVFSAIVTVIGFLIGSYWGPAGIAASLFFTMIVRIPLLFHISAMPHGVSQKDLYKVQFESIVGAVGGCLVAGLIFHTQSGVELLICTIVFCYVVAFGIAALSASGRRMYANAFHFVTKTVIGFIG